MKKIAIVSLLCLVQSLSVLAQAVAGLGAISGSVRDASGATVAGAPVFIVNEAKGIRRQLTANEAGAFSAPSLVPAGGYTVSIGKPGFMVYNRANIELQVGQNLTIDAVLQVAGSLVEVEVVAAAPLGEQTRTDVSQVVNI